MRPSSSMAGAQLGEGRQAAAPGRAQASSPCVSQVPGAAAGALEAGAPCRLPAGALLLVSLTIMCGIVLAPGLQACLWALMLMRSACCPLLGGLACDVSMHCLQTWVSWGSTASMQPT